MELEPTFPAHYYFDIPHMTVPEYVELVDELMRVRLDGAPRQVDRAADELEQGARKARDRLEALGQRYDPELELHEIDFERWTDQLASLVHSSFSVWELYTNPAFAKHLDDDEREGMVELAVGARAILHGMFGEDGREFFRMSYTDRFPALAAMLRTLARGELGPDIEAMMHEPLRVNVESLSLAYEERKRVHLHQRDASQSLAEQRAVLRFSLAYYVWEVGETADRWSQDSCDRVNAAIMPLVDCCRRMAQKH